MFAWLTLSVAHSLQEPLSITLVTFSKTVSFIKDLYKI